jgi:peroxiredoxin
MRKRSREVLKELVDLLFIMTGSTPWQWAPDCQETIARTVLIDQVGRSIRLGDLRSRIILLSFWRASSPQCRDNIAAIERLSAELEDLADQVKFVFVSIRAKEYTDDVAWLQQAGSRHSTHRWEDRDSDQLRVFFKGQWSWKVPNTFLISADGNIAEWTCGTTIDIRGHLQTTRALLAPPDAAA